MQDALKKLVEESFASKSLKTQDRKPKTLSYDIDNYKRLQEHCRQNGIHISDVVNDLIDLYLRTLDATKREKKVG